MKKKLYGLIALILLGITGCGTSGENELVGSLELKEPTALINDGGGYYHAEMTAVYTHPSKDATGVELKFTNKSYMDDGTIVFSGSESIKQPVGGWTIIWPRIAQRNKPIFVDLTVATGDLKQFKSFTIPALAPMTATPSSVIVTFDSPQTVNVSGSVGPYTIISTLPAGVTTDATEFSDKVTIFNSNVLPTQNGTIVVQSAFGDTVTINITY